MATDPADTTSGHRSNYRFLLSPKWIAFHILVILLVVAMANLSLWQLRRLDQRRDFNSQVKANANQPIAPLTDLDPASADPSAIEWRRVRVTGTFVPDRQFEVVNRSQNGETGRNVVAALALDDGSLVLVNRGFLPAENDVPPVPDGAVEVIGRVRASERRATGQAADEANDALTQIRRVDISVLAQQFDAPVLPVYIEQLESTPPDDPSLEPIVAPTLDEGPHLSYAVQWLIFSVCALVGWVLAVRRSIANRSGKPAKKRRSAYIPIADDDST